MKRHFRNVSEGRLFSSNIDFWKVIKLFLIIKLLSLTATYLLKREMKF